MGELLLVIPSNIFYKLNLLCVEFFIILYREDIRDVLMVHAGQTNPRELGVQQRKIEDYVNHPQFDYENTGYYFDVALLILNEVTN